jgi:hypothetical protein
MYEDDSELLMKQAGEPLIDESAHVTCEVLEAQPEGHHRNAKDAEEWLNPYSSVNRALFASYLSVGFGLYFLSTPLTFYMVRDSPILWRVIFATNLVSESD